MSDDDERPRRALDDPAELARAARITRTALERKARDERIREVVDAAGELSDEQMAQLRGLLAPPDQD